MGRFVIAAYHPKPGHEGELRNELRDHLPTLRREGLATERRPYVMRSNNGTYLEVFEWISSESIERAHENPAVAEMWSRLERICDHVALSELKEAGEPFAEFETVEL
jgi:hypothetical protein